MYYFRDDGSQDRYFIENDGHFLELKIDKKEVEVDGQPKIATVKSYVGLLKATLKVWEMRDEIDKAKLEHSSLINIAKDYHQYACTDGSECIVYEKKKPLMALRFGPVVGADFSTLMMLYSNFDQVMNDPELGPIVYDIERYMFEPSTNFTVGVSLNIWIPRFNEKLFLQMQTRYTKYYFFDTYESKQSAIDTHLRSDVMQMGIGIKYEYPNRKFRPTLAAGVAAIYLPNGTIKEITDNYSIYGVRPSTTKKDFPTKFMVGFEVSPGVHYYLTRDRIIFIQAQYMQCNKREFKQYPANNIRSFGISAGIYF